MKYTLDETDVLSAIELLRKMGWKVDSATETAFKDENSGRYKSVLDALLDVCDPGRSGAALSNYQVYCIVRGALGGAS